MHAEIIAAHRCQLPQSPRSRSLFIHPFCRTTSTAQPASCQSKAPELPGCERVHCRDCAASMPRLGHKKSRLGCRQCKARHVKCDELKPCSNCVRHGVPCSLVTWDPPTPQPHTATSAGPSSSLPRPAKEEYEDAPVPGTTWTSPQALPNDHAPNPSRAVKDESAPAPPEGSSPSSQSDHFPFLTPFIHRTDQHQADIWLRDLELMHHWTTEAYAGLSHRNDMQQLWRMEAPQHAVYHTFFMHELLAFAALHKAHKVPEQRAQYYSFGVHHQDLTIRGIREKLLNVTAHEAPAIVATSTLLTLSVFASTGFELNYPEIPSAQSAIEGILHIFILMQGMGNVLTLARTHVMNSFLAPMYRDPPEAVPSQPMLQELIHQAPTLVSFLETKPGLPEMERMCYLGIMRSLDPVLQMAMSPRVDNRELRFLFFWPLSLRADYIGFLRQRRPGALAILMYYATILYAAQPRYWFMEGWGEQLMQACYEELISDWQPAVRWPASFLKHNTSWNLFSSLVSLHHGPIPLLQSEHTSLSVSQPQQPTEVTLRPYASVSPGSHTLHNTSQYRASLGAQHSQRGGPPTHVGQQSSAENA